MLKELPHLDGILSEIEQLKQAQELLEKVYNECGTYGNQLSNKLQNEINNHFGFDDSE